MQKEISENLFDTLYIRQHDAEENVTDTNQEQSSSTNFQMVLKNLEAKYLELSQTISLTIDKKSVVDGVWNPIKKLVKVKESNNLKQFTAHHEIDGYYLFRFEALFLLECRSLAIYHQDILLSIEDAYELMLQNKNDFILYKIFATLARNGFYVHYTKDNCKQNVQNKIQDEIIDQNYNNKRPISTMIESETVCTKKITTEQLSDKKANYKVITSIRPLKTYHLPKLTKVDRKLLSCSKEGSIIEEKSNSFLYCVKHSAMPVEIHKLLRLIYDQEVTPLVDLGSVHSTSQLYSLMQQAGPKSYHKETKQIIEKSNVYFQIDFKVYPSKQHFNNMERPLFRVVVVNQEDTIPSSEDLSRLQQLDSSPLFFSLVSTSLEFNFYGFEQVTIGDEYPQLWQKYYAPNC